MDRKTRAVVNNAELRASISNGKSFGDCLEWGHIGDAAQNEELIRKLSGLMHCYCACRDDGDPQGLKILTEELENFRAKFIRDLIVYKPWVHNSTSPGANMLAIHKANVTAELVELCENLLSYLKYDVVQKYEKEMNAYEEVCSLVDELAPQNKS